MAAQKDDSTKRAERAVRAELAQMIGHRARAARSRAKLTQEDVAERTGIVPEVYGRLERGIMMPSVPTLWKLAVVFRISADELLNEAASRQG
jgi:transcriptional regulator with XRE-family HTH domain